MSLRPAARRSQPEHALVHAPGWAGLLAAWLLALLSGCTSLAPPEPPLAPLAVPQAWSMPTLAEPAAYAASGAALAAWWQRFGDPRLARLVESALQANTRIETSRAALQLAQASRDAAGAALWPVLTGSGSVQRGRSGGVDTGTAVEVGLDASWRVDAFGAIRDAREAGEAGVRASEASLGEVQVQIAAEVALNYILLRTAQGRTLIARESLVSQEGTLQITNWRAQAGLVSALEAEQARTAVELSRAQLPVLQASAAKARHALAVLTASAPDASMALAEAPGTGLIPQPSEGLTLAIPAETLRQRPDVRAAEHQVSAARSRVAQAQAQRWPSFTLGGTLGLGAATVGGLGRAGTGLAKLLAQLTVPMFDGGALRAELRGQQAGLAQAQQAYRASILTALQEVEDALVALRNDRLRLGSLRLAAAAAANAAELARQRYASGLIDFQTVLETQRSEYTTQDSVALTSADLGSDHVRLYTALGGGWKAP